MPRDLTAAMQASLAAEEGVDVVWFIFASFSGGDVRMCTASKDINWNGQTWEAVGGSIGSSAISEDADSEAQGVTLTLPNVDQALTQRFLTEHFIGRTVEIWKGHLNASTGLVVADPALGFRGEMLDDFSVKVDPVEGTSRIEGRVVSRVGRSAVLPILRMNTESHGRFFPGDLYYEFVPVLASKPIRWSFTVAKTKISGGGGRTKTGG